MIDRINNHFNFSRILAGWPLACVSIIFILGLMYYCYGINILFLIVKYGIMISYFLGMKGFCILGSVVTILGLLYEIINLILYNLICKNKIKITEEIKTITIVDNYLNDLNNISKMGISLNYKKLKEKVIIVDLVILFLLMGI